MKLVRGCLSAQVKPFEPPGSSHSEEPRESHCPPVTPAQHLAPLCAHGRLSKLSINKIMNSHVERAARCIEMQDTDSQ